MKTVDLHTSRGKKSLIFIVALTLMILSLILYYNIINLQSNSYTIPLVSKVFVFYILIKLFLVIFYTSYKNTKGSKDFSVSVVIPYYNEDLDNIKKQLDSLVTQTVAISKIYYICDGKTDKNLEVYRYLKSRSDITNLVVLASEKNIGKRACHGLVIDKLDTEITFFTDSDTILNSNAIEELLVPFVNEEILAVTGKVCALNTNESLLTKLLDIRYFSAFDIERGAYSVTGSVIVASGPATAYRTSALVKVKDDYVNQMFLGKIQTFGDDRCLTTLLLKFGKVVYQSTAIVYTLVPNTINHFAKQQVRWNKSFFRETIKVYKNMFDIKKPWVIFWTTLELVMFITLLFTLTYSIIGMVFFKSNVALITGLILLLTIVINSYVRNIYFVVKSFKRFLLAPIYGFIHLFLVTFIKLYSLLTLKNTKWGTR